MIFLKDLISMIKFTLMFFLFLPSLVFGNQLKLECELKDYNGINRSYTPRIIKSWIPEKQTHVIDTDSAFFKNLRVEGNVRTNNNKKIKIFYNYQNSAKQWAKYDFIYFKTTKKVAVSLSFPGYQPIGDVWGTCKEIKINDNKSVKKSNSNNENQENISDKLVCYRYGLYNGKYIKEAQRRNLNCKSENKEKINSSDKTMKKTEKAENKCKELGFTPATENYGNCVLKLMD